MPTKNTTTDNFQADVLSATGPVLVDFWAEWCGPCKMMTPILDKLADDHAGRLPVYKLNADENPELLDEYEVASIPTLKLFVDGQVVKTLVGAKPRPALDRELAEWLVTE